MPLQARYRELRDGLVPSLCRVCDGFPPPGRVRFGDRCSCTALTVAASAHGDGAARPLGATPAQLNERCVSSRPTATSDSTASAARATSAAASSSGANGDEHEVGDVARIAAAGAADADPQPEELRAPEPPRDRAQPVVAGEAAAEARLQAADLEVDLVVDDEQVLERRLVERDGGLHRAPGVVHVRVGLEQREPAAVDPDVGDVAAELAA